MSGHVIYRTFENNYDVLPLQSGRISNYKSPIIKEPKGRNDRFIQRFVFASSYILDLMIAVKYTPFSGYKRLSQFKRLIHHEPKYGQCYGQKMAAPK